MSCINTIIQQYDCVSSQFALSAILLESLASDEGGRLASAFIGPVLSTNKMGRGIGWAWLFIFLHGFIANLQST